MPNQRGGNRKGAGKKKPPEQKYRRRLITLPPDLDDRLIDWSIKAERDISPTLAKLIDNFLTSQGA